MDISLLFDDATMSGVFSIRGGDLRTDSDLRTSVLVSLFSDARALESDQIPDGSSDPRGWCGEVFFKSLNWKSIVVAGSKCSERRSCEKS